MNNLLTKVSSVGTHYSHIEYWKVARKSDIQETAFEVINNYRKHSVLYSTVKYFPNILRMDINCHFYVIYV